MCYAAPQDSSGHLGNPSKLTSKRLSKNERTVASSRDKGNLLVKWVAANSTDHPLGKNQPSITSREMRLIIFLKKTI